MPRHAASARAELGDRAGLARQIRGTGAPHGCQAARRLTGAAGFTADSGTAKARRDLNALLYADGIHDSLYRSAGRSLTQPSRQSAYAADSLPTVTTWGDVPALAGQPQPG